MYGLPENKTENDVVISAISGHLNIVISEESSKIDPAKTKPRPVIVKFARYNVRHKMFTNKQKLKGKEISISEK